MILQLMIVMLVLCHYGTLTGKHLSNGTVTFSNLKITGTAGTYTLRFYDAEASTTVTAIATNVAISAAPATTGAKVRANGMNRARMMVTPP